MKTAVSIPDDVFERADRLAAERGISRSQLYTDALRRLLDDGDEITRRLDEVYADDDQAEELAQANAALRSLRPHLDAW